jgi:large subunit ribosomal protein L25
MEKVVLNATKRTITGKHVVILRRDGKLPGVLYGHNIEPVAITMDLRDASNILSKLSGSSLVNVNIDGQEHAALVREKQRNYIKGSLIHVDFQVVSLTEKLRTDVSINLVGTSPAVKELNALVVSGIDAVEVECFPQDLPERIVVDISKLVNIGDAIYLKDLPIPANVIFLTDPNELIAVITAIKEEVVEVVAPVEGAEALGTEPEVIEKGKKEDELEEGEAKEGKPTEGKAKEGKPAEGKAKTDQK